jgi:hypothetical protein
MARWWLAAPLLLLFACTGEVAPSSSRAGTGASTGAGASTGVAGNGSGAQGTGATSSQAFVAADSVARRLSRAELDNTLRDVLGDDTRPAATILADDPFTPYDNDYEEQRASRALIDSLQALAEDVALRVTAPGLLPCTPTGPDDAACFRQVIETLGRRLFRRPLSEEEITAYLTLQAFATEDNPNVDNDFYTAVNLFLRSVLQDPEFLYRIEIGTATADPSVFTLNSYEIATRISYLLWGSTPDDSLLAAADADSLKDAAERVSQAARLLADPRARDQLHRFHAMWLGYRGIPHAADLVQAFDLETTSLIDRIVFDEPQSYLEMFRFGQSYMSTFLADHYGLAAPAAGEGWVDYGDSGRAGILSHGSVLSAFSKFSDTSPTQRGIFIQTRLLCNVIPPPPANVDVDQPPGEGGEAVCKYDRYAAHRESSTSCASCHNQIDPVGFGLENYDIAGRFREADDGHPECLISGDGELPGYGTFNGPAELAALLIDGGVLDDCIVRQLSSFALGRTLVDAEAVMVEDLRAGFESNGYSLTGLLSSYVESAAFALRKEPPPP